MKRKDVLLLLIPSLIFVLAWMSFSIYHSFINSTISEALNVQILPINPTFDTKTISSLKQRTHVNPIYEVNPSLIISPTLEPTQNETASSAATPTPKVSPTNSSQSTTGGTLAQ